MSEKAFRNGRYNTGVEITLGKVHREQKRGYSGEERGLEYNENGRGKNRRERLQSAQRGGGIEHKEDRGQGRVVCAGAGTYMGYKTKPVTVLKIAEINNLFQLFYPLSARSINTAFSFSVWDNLLNCRF